MKAPIVCILAGVLAGCASSVEDIEPAYVPAVAYQNYNCDQLTAEAQQVSARAQAAAAKQNKRKTGDAVKMTVGLLVFWPTLLFIKGDGPQAAEISRLKGEMSAIEEASGRLGCGIQFEKE